jgi:hypothetical protein
MQTMLQRPALELPERDMSARRPSRLRRTSRVTLMWAVATFALLQIGWRVVIDRWVPELRDPTFEIKARRLAEIRAAHPKPPVTVVMVGSSITCNVFKAASLEDLLVSELGQAAAVINMGNLGAGPLTQLIWIKRLVRRGLRPDFVFIEVAPHIYHHRGEPPDATRFPPPLLNEADLDVVERYVADPRLRQKWGEYRWLPCYAHRLAILNYLAQVLVPEADQTELWGRGADPRFWCPLDPRAPEQLQGIRARLKETFGDAYRDFTPGTSSVQALEELLEFLQKEKISACLVMVPQGPTLRSLFPVEKLRAFENKVADLNRVHGGSFVRALDWLEEAMFTDSMHPTAAGAEIFTERMAREVLLPTLLKNMSAARKAPAHLESVSR